jgi:hypothetical protein
LPHAAAVREPNGGTEYVLYRKDRVRVVAACCNSAMMMCFDDARHWIPIYRARFGPNAPAIQMRICTSFLPKSEILPNDVPAHRDYSPAFMMKLLSSGVAMLFRR